VITVVTSFGPNGYDTYGKVFISSFYKYWPSDVRLLCYFEGERPPGVVEGFDLLQIEKCASFLERHKDNLAAQGKITHPLIPWGQKEEGKGYNFRSDAYKFCRKIFAIAHAAQTVKTGKLFWVDADVETHSPVPHALLEDLLPDNCHVCYLSRPKYHSECGFVGYNLDLPGTHEFITEFEKQYDLDRFLKDKFWDDSPQFDFLVERLGPVTKPIRSTSLGQPFDRSVLGSYMTHYKGPRKLQRYK
jgi:hypothetical protein